MFAPGERWTFARLNKTSDQAHEHVSVLFHWSGTINVFTQEAMEGARMRRSWTHVIGYWNTTDSGRYVVRFCEASWAIDTIATQLARTGVEVLPGPRIDSEPVVTIRCRPSRNRWNGWVTDPNTLLGEGRNKDVEADMRSRMRKANGNRLMAFGAAKAARKALKKAKLEAQQRKRLTIDPDTLRVD